MLKLPPLFSDLFIFDEQSDFGAQLSSAGHSEIREKDYDFHGLKRGSQAFIVLQYTLFGEGRLHYEDKVFELQPSSLMLVNIPHNHRYFYPETSEPWQFLYVCLQGDEALKISKKVLALKGPLLCLNKDESFLKLFIEICHACHDKKISNSLAGNRLAYDLLFRLSEELLYPKSKVRPLWLNESLNLIQKDFAKELNVDDMAKASGFSRYHFSRKFRQELGLPPGEYLLNTRLNHAARLLQISIDNVTQVALASGFSDVNYFCRTFKKRFSESPGKYREKGLA